MLPEQEQVLIDLKDQLLDALSRVDALLCGDDPDAEDDHADGVVDPANAGRKRGIDYSGMRDRTVAFKERT